MATYHELQAARSAGRTTRPHARPNWQTPLRRSAALVSEYGLTSEDVFAPVRKTRNTAGQKVAPKYRDPASGETWTGRGKPPRWISEAADRESFAIKPGTVIHTRLAEAGREDFGGLFHLAIKRRAVQPRCSRPKE